MKPKNVPERYNYSKIIKEKEQKIIDYYKRVSNLNKERITIIPKQKKRTKKI